MIICTSELDDAQHSAVVQLSKKCKLFDQNSIPFYPHILMHPRPWPCNILYYNQQQLVGFLSIFLFYTNACEVVLMVDPTHRRQHIAKKMLTHLLAQLQAGKDFSLIFSIAPNFAENWLKQHGFCYKNSEYEMQRNSFTPLPTTHKALHIRKATFADLSQLVHINNACFFTKGDEMIPRFQALLNDVNYSLFFAEHNQQAVGKAHVQWLQNSARFSDIAILPQAQKNGFGRALVAHCIDHARTRQIKNITLDVDSLNETALKLYFNLGFFISNTHHYWSISLDTIQQYVDLRE